MSDKINRISKMASLATVGLLAFPDLSSCYAPGRRRAKCTVCEKEFPPGRLAGVCPECREKRKDDG